MADVQIAALERQARCFVHPVLIGSDADLAVKAIVAWEIVNERLDPGLREAAWARITKLACPRATPSG